VRYDAEAMLGILTLEAQRANALVIGEDLGTIEAGVRDVLAERSILGSTVLWFETNESGTPLPPEHWRPATLATVTTHDLPTTAGLLALSHVELRDRLALLDRSPDEEHAAEARKRDGWLTLAAERQLLPSSDIDAIDRTDAIAAMNALLFLSPCRLLAVALPDFVGDPRQPNQPGTIDEYPNWCLSLAQSIDGNVAPVPLDEVLADPRAEQIVQFATRGVGQRSVR
jgi:4-alpha-glucanotransferase